MTVPQTQLHAPAASNGLSSVFAGCHLRDTVAMLLSFSQGPAHREPGAELPLGQDKVAPYLDFL
jgi:hypothetical protein